MSRELRILQLEPGVVDDAPEVIGRVVRKHVVEHPDAMLLVVVAPHAEAEGFLNEHLWQFGPAENGNAGD